MSEYQPASCNIGEPQRRRRWRLAVASFAATGAYVLGVVVGAVPGVLLVGVFVPLSFGFEWAVQAYTAFCVRLAVLDRYDFRGDGGTAGSVSDPGHRRADHVYAARITAVSVALAGLTTLSLLALV